MKAIGRTRPGWWIGPALGCLMVAGCGQQDLYKPPQSPYSVVGSLALPSSGEDVAVLGNTAFVAAGEGGMVAVDISRPSAPRLASISNTPHSAVGIKAASLPESTGVRDIAFVADGIEGISIFDVTRPDTVTAFQAFDTYDASNTFVVVPDTPSDPYQVFIADNWRGLWQLSSVMGAPGSLYMAGRSYTLGSAKAVAVADGFAYVADDEMGLVVLDARVPVALQVVSSQDTPGTASGVALENGYAFVADGKDGLVVMSIHLGDKPTIVAHLALAGNCHDVAVRGGYAFLAAEDGGVHIVDVTNPTSPRWAGTEVTPYATGVDITTSGVVAVSDRDAGLVLLGGPSAYVDHTPPGSVGDLTATPRTATSILLGWHAPGNDLYEGTANRYELRRWPATITEVNWDSAAVCTGVPSPLPSGSLQQFEVAGLDPSTRYYFALKAADGVPLWSALSNVATAVTLNSNVAPTLTDVQVTPFNAAPGTAVSLELTYTDADGDAPSQAQVLIDGQAHAMTAQGTNYAAGARFHFDQTYQRGSHNYAFAFDDGHSHPVSLGPTTGPWIGDVIVLGSPADEPGRDADETQHSVALPWNVVLSDHEVTQAEYDSLVSPDPSTFHGANRPVETVSWFDAVAYCNARSVHAGLTPAYTIVGDSVAWDRSANGYRLPTEAEWERACRAGSATAFPNGAITVETCVDGSQQPDAALNAIGWYCGNAGTQTHDVKTKQPNANGMYDMNGNVWEWCWDWYSVNGVVGDPTGPAKGVQRVIRGGSWYYFARDCRSAARAPYWPTSKDDIIGFRLARTIP